MPVPGSHCFKSDLLHFIHEEPQTFLSQVKARAMLFQKFTMTDTEKYME